MKSSGRRRQFRRLRANWRDIWLLLREFAWPLAFFSLALIVGGIGCYLLARSVSEPVSNFSEAANHVLSLAKIYVEASGRLPGLSVGDVEDKYEVSSLLLRQDGDYDLHPDAKRCLSAGMSWPSSAALKRSGLLRKKIK